MNYLLYDLEKINKDVHERTIKEFKLKVESFNYITPDIIKNLINENNEVDEFVKKTIKMLIYNEEHPENHIIKYIKRNPIKLVINDQIIDGVKNTHKILLDPVIKLLKIKFTELLDNDETALDKFKGMINYTVVKKAISKIIKKDLLKNKTFKYNGVFNCYLCGTVFKRFINLEDHLINKKCNLKNFKTIRISYALLNITPEFIEEYDKNSDINKYIINCLLLLFDKNIKCIVKNPVIISINDKEMGLRIFYSTFTEPIVDILKTSLKSFVFKYKKSDLDFDYSLYDTTIKKIKSEITSKNVKRNLRNFIKYNVITKY